MHLYALVSLVQHVSCTEVRRVSFEVTIFQGRRSQTSLNYALDLGRCDSKSNLGPKQVSHVHGNKHVYNGSRSCRIHFVHCAFCIHCAHLLCRMHVAPCDHHSHCIQSTYCNHGIHRIECICCIVSANGQIWPNIPFVFDSKSPDGFGPKSPDRFGRISLDRFGPKSPDRFGSKSLDGFVPKSPDMFGPKSPRQVWFQFPARI